MPKVSFLLFLMLIIAMRRRGEFKVPLGDPGDGNILFRSSTIC